MRRRGTERTTDGTNVTDWVGTDGTDIAQTALESGVGELFPAFLSAAGRIRRGERSLVNLHKSADALIRVIRGCIVGILGCADRNRLCCSVKFTTETDSSSADSLAPDYHRFLNHEKRNE